VELSREAWNRAKAAITCGGFLGEDAIWEELLAYRYFLYKEKMELRRMIQELDHYDPQEAEIWEQEQEPQEQEQEPQEQQHQMQEIATEELHLGWTGYQKMNDDS
jgi:hypothetical protein